LDGCFLILGVDGAGRDTMDYYPVGWYDKLRLLAKTSEPPLILLELCSLGCGAREYLYIATL
jgi:hypothetical protein